jgi:hypothetical protein
MFELRAHGLTLRITALGHPAGDVEDPYERRIACRVEVDVPSFRGELDWGPLEDELLQFADDLDKLERQLGSEAECSLQPIERGVILSLHMNAKGQIDGSYRFSDSNHSDGPELFGSFTIDQSYLPALAASVRALAGNRARSRT